MKTNLLAVTIVGTSLCLSFLQAQDKSAARATYVRNNEVDLRPQYEAALSRTKDGRVLLSTLSDGTKVFLKIQSHKPIELILIDNAGQPVPVSFARLPGGGCRGRLAKKTNSTILVPCFEMNKH